jgi:aspartyl-tRNA(Asn)/glutamyl-tRNA(Gln) amidotransferase subunit C
MSISREEVEHVAYLARLGLTEEEKNLFQGQLSDILQHVAMINQLDTGAIPPTAQVIPLQNVMRGDVAAPCYPPEEILANAPRVEDHYFRIPPVLEEQEAELDGPPDV